MALDICNLLFNTNIDIWAYKMTDEYGYVLNDDLDKHNHKLILKKVNKYKKSCTRKEVVGVINERTK